MESKFLYTYTHYTMFFMDTNNNILGTKLDKDRLNY